MSDNTCLKLKALAWADRVAKCHEYDEDIHVKIFRGWGKKSERTHNMTKLGLF